MATAAALDGSQLRSRLIAAGTPLPRRSPPPTERGLVILLAVFAVVGALGWAFHSAMAWVHHALGSDWMVFYTAARAYLDGHLDLIFHGGPFMAALDRRFADWPGVPADLHPWVYPPPFLLLFLPFALLPPWISYLLFELGGFIAAVAAVWLYTRGGSGRRLAILSLVLSPAVPFTVFSGQNAFYTSALLVGGVGMLARSPLLGGTLLGILTFKPQLWLMVPVALTAARAWRALIAASVVAVGLAFVGLALFGFHSWQAWFKFASGHGELYRGWLSTGRIGGMSIFTCATLLGASSAVANLAQAAAAVVAAAFVYWTFARPAPGELRLSVLFCATILAAPHVSDQDALLLGLSASLFLSLPIRSRWWPLWAAGAVSVWISPLFNPPAWFSLGLATPVLLLFFLACAAFALRRTESLELRAALPGIDGA